MAKFGSLVNLGTAVKVAGGVVAGGLSTAGVQHYMSSSEEPAKTEIREEQKKKLQFEVEQRSNELEQKEQRLKALEETLARRETALQEARSAVQRMQQAVTAVVAAEPTETVAVQAVEPSEAPSTPEAKKETPVAPTPTDNAPKRPAVFDGGGNKEPVVTEEPATGNDGRASRTSSAGTPTAPVAFGSSGDVVAIEKDGTVSDAETERLRKEVENLKRQLAEKEGSSKKEDLGERELSIERSADFALKRKAALEERERRLAEREQALRERIYADKAKQTDDDPYEEVFGGDDPFDKPGSKKLKKPAPERRYSFNKASPVTAKRPERKNSVSLSSSSALALTGTGKKTKTATSEANDAATPKKSDMFSRMSKDEIKAHSKEEVQRATDAIDLKTLEKISGESGKTKEEQQAMVSEFKNTMCSILTSQPKEVSDYSIEQVLKGHPNRSQYEKQIEVLRKNVPFAKDVQTVGALNAVATVILGKLTPNPAPLKIYAELLIKSADEAAKHLKNLPKETEDEIELREARLKEVLGRRDTLRKNVDEILQKEPAPVTVAEGLQKLADAKANAGDIVKALYEEDGSGLLKGFEKMQNDWERVRTFSEALYPSPVPSLSAPPPMPGDSIVMKSDGLSDVNWVNDLKAEDKSFRDQDDRNTKAYDDALDPYRKAQKEKLANVVKLNNIGRMIRKQEQAIRKAEKEKRTADAENLKKELEENRKEETKLLTEQNELTAKMDEAKRNALPVAQTWKAYRQSAFNDPKKKLLVSQRRWLNNGLEDKNKVDPNVLKAKGELFKASKRLSASEVKRLEILGVKYDDDGSTALTEQQKEARKQFTTDAEECEKLSETLKDKYKAAVRRKASLEGVDVQNVSADRYRVTLHELSVFGTQAVYDCLTALAPGIEELTIERFDNESAGTPFLNFAKLCRRLTVLKKLSVKGIFGANFDQKNTGTTTFFGALSENKLPDEFLDAKLGLDGEMRFFDVIALIPGLETFEMYSTDRDENPNDTDGELRSAEQIYAVVEPLKEVRLPNIDTKTQFFDCLTYGKTVVKKHLKLCTNSFGGMMRTPGVPEALYRLLESGKATIEWFGNLGTGDVKCYTDGDDKEGNLALPEKDSNTVAKITQTVKDQETDGKHLEDWVSDAHFVENFLKNPEIYWKLSGVHSEVFKRMLAEYNENELNPLYFACKKLEVLKKVQTKVAFENVFPNDPLSDILKKYPVLKNNGVMFDGVAPTINGSVLGKTILPALLNLVLRERIDGKNYIVLATEDGEQMTEEYTDEVTGKTMKRKLKGQFSNTYWWYFPSPANSLWAKEAFAVSTDDEAFLSLRNEEKEDLKGKMMEASADLSNFIDVGLDYEIASCRLDPAAGRACLSKIAPKPILYWNYFSKAMKTGNLRVATDAPADKRTLFEIFSEVANAQPAHEKLYEAFEKMYAENNKLQPLKSAVNELKEKIDSLQSPDAEEQRKKEEENLSKKEEELKLVTEEFEKHRAIMDACADSLTKTRDFLKEKLPYLKEVAKDIDGTAGQKAKPAAAAQPNLPGNNNNTAGGVPQVVVPKHLFKIGVTNLVGSKNDPNDIDSWIKGGRKVKYKFGNKGLFDVLDTQWGVIMPAAGFVLPAGKVPKEADVEKAVRANVLKIEKNGNEYYVVLTVRQIQQNIP